MGHSSKQIQVVTSNLIQITNSKMGRPKKTEKKVEESPESSPVKESSPEKPKKITGVMKPIKLSADLAAIVGTKEASRAECIKQLWAYMKKNNLQDPENKQYFTPDKKMAKIFGTEKLRGFGMAKFLNAHLTAL